MGICDITGFVIHLSSALWQVVGDKEMSRYQRTHNAQSHLRGSYLLNGNVGHQGITNYSLFVNQHPLGYLCLFKSLNLKWRGDGRTKEKVSWLMDELICP